MYDNIRFHLDEDYPDQLPPENAATHIGMYWQWVAGRRRQASSTPSGKPPPKPQPTSPP